HPCSPLFPYTTLFRSVVVYKASRMINFAVGEWTMLGARTTAAASHTFGVGLAGAIGIGCTAMVALALLFNRLVLRPLLRRSLLSDRKSTRLNSSHLVI